MIFEIKDKDARGAKGRTGYQRFADEILVTRADLDDLKANKEYIEWKNNWITPRSEIFWFLGKKVKKYKIILLSYILRIWEFFILFLIENCRIYRIIFSKIIALRKSS